MRHNKLIIVLIGMITSLLCLFSCKVTKPYQAPQSNATGLYRDVVSTDTNSIEQMKWQQVFTDTLLQKLINYGISHNTDLQTAYSRIRQAQAYYGQSRLAYYPSLNADASASFNSLSNGLAINSTTKSHVYRAEFTSSWEADIWGKLKSNEKANLALFLQAEANARAVQTSLVANIANNYYSLLSLDQQLTVTQESVKNWQSTVDMMKKLKIADVVTGAAVVQSEASKYAVAVTIPDLKQSIWQTENIINILLGKVPGAVLRASLNAQSPISNIVTGVPASLLASRPDVQAAEYGFRNSFELTNVARTYFYPSVTLTAAGGYTSLTSFFSGGSLVGNLIAGLTQPIFNNGANKTHLQVAKEAQQQAALSYQYTLLNAGEEVSNALHSYQTAADKFTLREQQLDNLKKSVNYTQQLVRYGSANYTEVLTAQQSLLTAQLDKINDKLQQLQAIVSLYRSLGGG